MNSAGIKDTCAPTSASSSASNATAEIVGRAFPITTDPGDVSTSIFSCADVDELQALLRGLSIEQINYKNEYGWSPLHAACTKRDLDTVHHLLRQGADVNALDKSGSPPLHYASTYGNSKIVQALLRAGAQVNIKDNDSTTALQHAAEEERAAVCAVLIEHGASITHKSEHFGSFRDHVRKNPKLKEALRVGMNRLIFRKKCIRKHLTAHAAVWYKKTNTMNSRGTTDPIISVLAYVFG